MAPQRKHLFKVDSAAVQGEGSYVVMKAINWGEAKRLRKEIADMDDDGKLVRNEQLLLDHVHEWNWVDEDGEPLPQLKDDPSIIDRLTQQEITWLGEALSGNDNTKN